MKDTVLSAKQLCKSFAHNGGQAHILSHVDLDLYGGFYRYNGGKWFRKSTLLYALSGMDRATAGEVIYNGRDIVSMKERSCQAAVYGLWFYLSADASGEQFDTF